MSNYTISVDWDGKDALADSNAAKVISGDDFQTEFETVQTAVNSKANLNGSASEDFTMATGIATTQSTSDNSTKVATTAYVTTAVTNNHAFPIGAIFTTTVAYANSAAVVAVIGGTAWEAFGAGRVLVGFNSGDGDFNSSQETGGAKTASGTSGSTALSTSQMPSHSHSSAAHTHTGTIRYNSGLTDNAGSCSSDSEGGQGTFHVTNAKTTGSGGGGATSSTGSGSGHTHSTSTSTVQPYIVVYFWKRTA